MDSNRFATFSLTDPRIMRILSTALEAVDPFKAVQKSLPMLEGRVFGLGIGKAALPMMDALVERIPIAGGLAVTKFASGGSRELYTVIEGGHPIPDARSLAAGERVLEFVSSLKRTIRCLFDFRRLGFGHCTLYSLEVYRPSHHYCYPAVAHRQNQYPSTSADPSKWPGCLRATSKDHQFDIVQMLNSNPLKQFASGYTTDPTTRDDALSILKIMKLNGKFQIRSEILLQSAVIGLGTLELTAMTAGA
jgi:hypothetical protein